MDIRLPTQAAPPRIGVHGARTLAAQCFGVKGALAEFDSERDRIFRLTTNEGTAFVLRISDAERNRAALEFENEVIFRAVARDSALPLPQPQVGLRDTTVETGLHRGHRYLVRLFSFLPGVRVADLELSPALCRDIGRTFAALDAALQSLPPPAHGETLLWNLHRIGDLQPLCVHVEDPVQRRMVEAVFDRVHRGMLAKLPTMRPQVIHNDCNARNVLVDPAHPQRVCGIIDFGDLAHNALVVELGVAVARQARLRNVLASGCDVVEGYHGRLPLHRDEIETLFDVVCARLAMKSLIWCWRGSLGDPRHSGRMGDTFALLEEWLRHGPERATDGFLAACRRAERTSGDDCKEQRC
jgi:hydroxylysine kinase